MNYHKAKAWYVRFYLALPARMRRYDVMTIRVGMDCETWCVFVSKHALPYIEH